MCLLIALREVVAGFPLVLAANRDEFLERPATPMTVLADGPPRVIGGRDEQALGTWLAVNEYGVVAGLTNQPAGATGRDPAKRSRGEIPLAVTLASDLAAGVAAVQALNPGDFNPAWLLAGDASQLFYLDVSGSAVTVERLGPGIHILENRPLHAPSPKADFVRTRLAGIERVAAADLIPFLTHVLASHEVVPGAEADSATTDPPRPAAVSSPCVHTQRGTEHYGTRWSGIIRVPVAGGPSFAYADGPPCTASYVDATALLRATAVGPE